MPALKWNNWFRSEGCRYHMDRNEFQGLPFSAIFWKAMGNLFYDKDGRAGALYNGKIAPEAASTVSRNGRRLGFDEQDQVQMLTKGDFVYRRDFGQFHMPPLRIEGPDLPAPDRQWAQATCPGFEIDFHFYNVIRYGKRNFGSNRAEALDRMIWFVGAVMLHEIMHNNGFGKTEPDKVDWEPGSDYASLLTHVAMVSVLRASPHSDFFDTLIDIDSEDSLTRFTFGTIQIPPEDDQRTEDALQTLDGVLGFDS